MAHYIRRRLITAVPVFFGITLVVFFFMNLAPGSVTDLMGEGASSAEEQAALEAALGLDKPLLPVMYCGWRGFSAGIWESPTIWGRVYPT